MKDIVIYTMKRCSYCEAAKKLLTSRGIKFKEILLGDDDDAAWEALTAKSGMRTAPQIFAGDVLIGGFDALDAQDKKDKLKSLL